MSPKKPQFQNKDQEIRYQRLASKGHNLDLLESQFVTYDCLTDSLVDKDNSEVFDTTHLSNLSSEELICLLQEYFGYEFYQFVPQGRTAEALLSYSEVQAGQIVLGSALFATTRAHFQLAGATCIETMVSDSKLLYSNHFFKGNLDVDLLRKQIKHHGSKNISFILVEPCNNAIGGHPISLNNMSAVNQLAKEFNIRIYIDACRIIENAILIQQREESCRHKSIENIIREFCDYADGCTFSLTKGLNLSYGGFFATNKKEVYEKSFDLMLLNGLQMPSSFKKNVYGALKDRSEVFRKALNKVTFVEQLHSFLAEQGFKVIQPSSGHGVYVSFDANDLNGFTDVRSWLYQLFIETGIRGALSSGSVENTNKGILLIRFAIDLHFANEVDPSEICKLLIQFRKSKQFLFLEKSSQPAGLTGELRAVYQVDYVHASEVNPEEEVAT